MSRRLHGYVTAETWARGGQLRPGSSACTDGQAGPASPEANAQREEKTGERKGSAGLPTHAAAALTAAALEESGKPPSTSAPALPAVWPRASFFTSQSFTLILLQNGTWQSQGGRGRVRTAPLGRTRVVGNRELSACSVTLSLGSESTCPWTCVPTGNLTSGRP